MWTLRSFQQTLTQSLDRPFGHGMNDPPRATCENDQKQRDQRRIKQAVFGFLVHRVSQQFNARLRILQPYRRRNLP